MNSYEFYTPEWVNVINSVNIYEATLMFTEKFGGSVMKKVYKIILIPQPT
jgi:hypothetical protein